jgi:hypothetical protein
MSPRFPNELLAQQHHQKSSDKWNLQRFPITAEAEVK